MNILKYKWPVIVAAGLHGALFISFPSTRIIQASPVIADSPPPPFKPEMIQVEEPDPSSSSEEVAPSGSPALPETAETPPPPVLDRSAITVPLHETTSVLPIEKSLAIRPPGRDGPIGDGTLSRGTINLPKDLDRVPRATAQIPPDYPATLRNSGEKGSVTVEFDVDITGRVVRASALRYTHRELVDPAVRAVLRWHFEPGKRNGRVVPFRMAVPIEFGLSEN